MLEAKLDAQALNKLLAKLEKAPEVFTRARSSAFDAAAPKLKRALDAQITATIGDSHGKVRSWQEQVVGSRGGYAAVRPKKDAYTAPTKKMGRRYAVGYVTNAITSGHRFPGQSVRGKGQRARADKLTTGRVSGRYFYDRAQSSVSAIAQATVEQVMDTLTKHLEGT